MCIAQEGRNSWARCKLTCVVGHEGRNSWGARCKLTCVVGQEGRNSRARCKLTCVVGERAGAGAGEHGVNLPV